MCARARALRRLLLRHTFAALAKDAEESDF